MNLIEVKSKDHVAAFIQFPIRLYQREKNWIRPLDKDIERVFDPKLNKTWEHGLCIRWLLEDQGQTIGRIAAFINEETIHKDNDQPTGGVGFFECIDDQCAANLLFDTAKHWLIQQGVEAMDGPINFGDRDKWWGLLVEGFDIEPNYQCNYNFPYYKTLFENYGFQLYFKQYTFIRNILDPFHPKIQCKADLVNRNSNYTFEHLRISELDKYTEDFRSIYNQAWAGHDGVAEMSKNQSQAIMKQMKPIIDEKIIWFAYYMGNPVAFYVNLPEVNQVFRYVNGKLNRLGKLKFLWHQWVKTNKKMLGLVFGIVPEHQGKGVDGALVMATAQMVQQDYKRYSKLEMNWIGDFNLKMLLVVKQVGGEIGKIHHTYRYLFDRDKPFKRMPIK